MWFHVILTTSLWNWNYCSHCTDKLGGWESSFPLDTERIEAPREPNFVHPKTRLFHLSHSADSVVPQGATHTGGRQWRWQCGLSHPEHHPLKKTTDACSSLTKHPIYLPAKWKHLSFARGQGQSQCLERKKNTMHSNELKTRSKGRKATSWKLFRELQPFLWNSRVLDTPYKAQRGKETSPSSVLFPAGIGSRS